MKRISVLRTFKGPHRDESGRTMVEMLGVLAVIALLGGLGIALYRHTLNKHLADTLYNDIKTRLILTNERKGTLFSVEPGNESTFNLPITTLRDTPVHGFNKVSVSNVKEEICSLLIKKEWPQGARLYINNLVYPNAIAECPSADATFAIATKTATVTAEDALPKTCQADSECGECGSCGPSKECQGCPEDKVCAYNFENPTQAKQCRPVENVIDDAYCAYPDGNGNCCDSSGGNCCPPDRPILGRNGTCYGCDQNVTIEVDQNTQKCARCPNRTWRNASYGYMGWCIPKSCPVDKPLMSYDGICSSCGSTVQMGDLASGRSYLTTCSACSEQNAMFDNYMCKPCPNNMIVDENGKCVCEEGKMASYNSTTSTPKASNMSAAPVCRSCGSDYLNAIPFSRFSYSNGCSACPDRIVVKPGSGYFRYCALATCPSGYMHNSAGHCMACSTTSAITFKASGSSPTFSCAECNDTPHRRYTDGNYCRKCPAQGTTAWNNLTATQKEECTPADPCAGQTPTGCVKTLGNVNGTCAPTEYQAEGFACDTGKVCNANHECVCDGYMKNGVCTSCPQNATCNGATFTCNSGYNLIESTDTCEEICAGQTPTGCVKTLGTVNGTCAPTEYQAEGFACDTGKVCNANHECVCDGYMKNGVCTSCPQNASCNGATFSCSSGYDIVEPTNTCEETCGPNMWRALSYQNNQASSGVITGMSCKSCTDKNVATTGSAAECTRCANRFLSKDSIGNPKCYYCGEATYIITTNAIADIDQDSCNACDNRHYESGVGCVCNNDMIYTKSNGQYACCAPGKQPNNGTSTSTWCK